MKNTVKELQGIIQNKGQGKKTIDKTSASTPMPKLEIIHEAKLLYKGRCNNFYVLGNLSQDLSVLKITLLVAENDTEKRERYKLDLYEPEQVKEAIEAIALKFQVKEEILEADLQILTSLLEKHRDGLVEAQQANAKKSPSIQRIMAPVQERAAIEFLSAANLAERTDQLLAKAGVIGQEKIRLLAFLAGTSYKSDTPLHLAIAGNPANVNMFINACTKCLAPEDAVMLGNVSGRSFYHCTNGELMNKVLILPNGLDKKAGQALNQLQQEKSLSTATTIKDRLGNMISSVKQVQSHFSTIMCENNDEVNQEQFRVCLDESSEQTTQIINYQNNKFSDMLDSKEEQKATDLLKFIVRSLKPVQVINPNANKVILPVKSNALIKMNQIYQGLVRQVCIFHQFQRKKDEQGRLIAEIEDMEIAGEMLFNAMVMETDELDSAQRQVYEGIKNYVKKQAGEKANDYRFTLREIRIELHISKNYCFRYMQELHELEYVERIGHANKGFKYRILYWDDAEKVKETMKNNLNNQLAILSGLSRRSPDRPLETNGDKAFTAGGLNAA